MQHTEHFNGTIHMQNQKDQIRHTVSSYTYFLFLLYFVTVMLW